MARLKNVYRIGMIALVAGVTAACGTGTSTSAGSGKMFYVLSYDAPALSGLWSGYMVGPSGTSFEATLTVRPDSTYTLQAGAISSQGKAEAKDGQIHFVSSSTTGGMQVGERAGSAVLIDRDNSWRLVGSGRAPAGPYNFEFTRPK